MNAAAYEKSVAHNYANRGEVYKLSRLTDTYPNLKSEIAPSSGLGLIPHACSNISKKCVESLLESSTTNKNNNTVSVIKLRTKNSNNSLDISDNAKEAKLYVVEKIKLQDLLFEEYLKIECNARNAIQNQWQVSQLEDIWGIELTKLGTLVYENHKAQKGLQNIASKFGFIVSKENASALNGLYRIVNTALGRTITDEHLQLLTICYFLDRNYVQNSISRDEIKSNEFFDKLTQEFTDQAALKILLLIKTINANLG